MMFMVLIRVLLPTNVMGTVAGEKNDHLASYVSFGCPPPSPDFNVAWGSEWGSAPL